MLLLCVKQGNEEENDDVYAVCTFCIISKRRWFGVDGAANVAGRIQIRYIVALLQSYSRVYITRKRMRFKCEAECVSDASRSG